MMFEAGIIVISCLAVSTAYAQNTFTIKGKLGKDKEGELIIFYQNGNKYIKDSTQVKNGIFELKREFGDPNQATFFSKW